MDELFKGVKEFSKNNFEKNKSLYQSLSNKQNPHTLFIACSDSRVVPNLMTNSLPGDLFIIRNIANIVPPYRESANYLSTSSAIEYSVKVLRVNNIVINGHSNCGGCKALYSENESKNIPYTKKWIELAKPVKEKLNKIKNKIDNQSYYRLVEQENIIMQMHNLHTYPFIKVKYNNKSLNIYGWYYDIGSGIIYNYNKSKRLFEMID